MGHLARVMAVAEAVARQGHDAVLATSDPDSPLIKVLDPAVRCVPTARSALFQTAPSRIVRFETGPSADRANLEGLGPTDPTDLAALAEEMAAMNAADTQIIATVNPDVIVCDHRHVFGPARTEHAGRFLHISNLLGLASLHKRATGQLPYPLEDAPLLVPGIAEIEPDTAPGPPIHMCGPFHWRGWSRWGAASQPGLGQRDVAVFFGSTGNSTQNLPLLEDRLSGHLSAHPVSMPSPESTNTVDLASAIQHSTCLLCHGGHGTVMEALSHGVPVVVFPTNPEQLEIGHRLQTLNLGRLVPQPIGAVTGQDLGALVQVLRSDPEVQEALEQTQDALSRKRDGAEHAAKIILHHALANVV